MTEEIVGAFNAGAAKMTVWLGVDATILQKSVDIHDTARKLLLSVPILEGSESCVQVLPL